MKVQQISIFLENRLGRLNHITALLGQAGINIRALSLADTSDFGILRLIVDQPEHARKVLEDGDIIFKFTEVIAVEVPDKPGGLARVLAALTDASINVEYMYAFVEKAENAAIMVFRFEQLTRAGTILRENGFTVLTNEEVLAL